MGFELSNVGAVCGLGGRGGGGGIGGRHEVLGIWVSWGHETCARSPPYDYTIATLCNNVIIKNYHMAMMNRTIDGYCDDAIGMSNVFDYSEW